MLYLNLSLKTGLTVLTFAYLDKNTENVVESFVFTLFLGAQIIDLMILVIDIVKGMQTQTAECLVIGEITCPKMIVVLNKVDLLPPDKKEAMIEKVIPNILKLFV